MGNSSLPEPARPDPARPDPAQQGQRAQPGSASAGPAATGEGAPATSGNGGGKTVIQGQLIAAGGAVLAALIGGAVALIVAFHHSGPSGSPPPPGVRIQGERWFSPVNGTRVIRVTGTVQGLPFGEVVFAMAGFSENTPPFYSGGPAKVSKNGTWVTDIKGVPASALSLTFWPSEAPSSVGAACSPACAAAAFARDRRRLDEAGPHAAFLTHVGQPVHGTAPGQ